MICGGSGRWPVSPAPTLPFIRRRGYCPDCGCSHALTNTGRLYAHTTTGEPLPTERTP